MIFPGGKFIENALQSNSIVALPSMMLPEAHSWAPDGFGLFAHASWPDKLGFPLKWHWLPA